MQMVATDYPIHGLRPIGACGPRGDGYNSAYVTGQMMAGMALRDMAMWEAQGKQMDAEASKGGDA